MKNRIKLFLQILSAQVFQLWGWKIVGFLPKISKYVVTVAPHRSGLGDVLRGLIVKTLQPTPPVKFPAKYEIMRVPIIGHFLKWIGGVAVDRNKNLNGLAKGEVTKILLNHLVSNSEGVSAFAVEGTRDHGARWRTGFYQVSLGANVPVVMVAFDYKRKTVWISEPLKLTGNKTIDITNIKDWYKLVVPEYKVIIFEEDF